jgi:hypothetical protein
LLPDVLTVMQLASSTIIVYFEYPFAPNVEHWLTLCSEVVVGLGYFLPMYELFALADDSPAVEDNAISS